MAAYKERAPAARCQGNFFSEPRAVLASPGRGANAYRPPPRPGRFLQTLPWPSAHFPAAFFGFPEP